MTTEEQKAQKRAYDKVYRQRNKDRRNDYNRAYYQQHPEQKDRVRERTQRFRSEKPDYERHYARVRKYGITPEQYADMLAQQNGVCAICGQPETAKSNAGETRALNVDHDHATGKVRSLLCSKCNMAVGLLDDDSGRARRVADYLDQWADDAKI